MSAVEVSAADVAYFDVFDPDFRVDSPDVLAAARANWWARTPIGLAILRYGECTALLRDRRLRHGWHGVNSAIPLLTRTAVEDLNVSGLDIAAGTHLCLFLAAAQREPAVFGEGSPFDITASRPAQLAFGGGIHYCLGAALARAEMQEALPILAARLHHLAFDDPAIWRPPVGIHGPVSLPLRFASAQ